MENLDLDDLDEAALMAEAESEEAPEGIVEALDDEELFLEKLKRKSGRVHPSEPL